MSETTGTAWRMHFPILKALPDADTGEIRHGGIASDEVEDLQGETVFQSLLKGSLDYLNKHGKFNWEHHKSDIGDVLSARPVDVEEAMELFGVPIEKAGLAVEGNVYPLVDPALADQDLKTAHHRLRAGARLGYSLDGIAIKKSSGEFRSLACTRLAIATQPINPNSVCRVVTKSLAAVAEAIGVSDIDLPSVLGDLPGDPDILIECEGPGCRVESGEVSISKSLFGTLVRQAFGPRNAPPLGGLVDALRKLAKH